MQEDKVTENLELRRAIVETIAFFDLFEYPLTQNEILKYLQLKTTYLAIFKELELLVNEKTINREGGLYFLEGRIANISERKKKYNYSARKFKIAMKISRIFRFIPWIQLICVANLIGRDNLREEGDIDLFIVSDKNRLWLTRFFTVLVAKLLNVRPQINNTKDKICLSFFISEEQMNLENIRDNKMDMYFNYWFINLAPIYSRDNSFSELMKANEKILESFPNYFPQKISDKRKIKSFHNDFYKKNWELFFGGLEKNIKKFQLKIMPENLKKLIP